VILGFLLALLLNERARGISFFRTAFYIPAIVPAVAASFIWLWLFQPDLGLMNSFLGTLGITGPTWFASSDWALPTLIFINAWSVGSGMLIYLAGLQSVPTALYEAAKLDGAGAWGRFVNVTVPMTSPVILFNVVVGLIGTFQGGFTQAFVITQGGPANATLFFVYYLYQNGWRFFQMGYASALAWVLFAIIFILTLLMIRMSTRLVYYEGGLRN
jgi:multiple sugar transport system permease protein